MGRLVPKYSTIGKVKALVAGFTMCCCLSNFPSQVADCRRFSLVLVLLTIWCPAFAATPGAGAKGGPTAADDRFGNELKRLLGDLDSDRFDQRQRAARRLDELVADPEWRSFLAIEFRRALRRSDISFEVRWHLNRWTRQLPEPPMEPAAATSEEIDQLVRQLDDDSCAVRLGAAERMDWLLNNPTLACAILTRVKQRLAQPSLSAEARRQLEGAWERARAAWLLADTAPQELPPVTDGQIDHWLDDLVRPLPSDEAAKSSTSQSTAHRELLDLLARDEYVPKLKAAITLMLRRNLDSNAASRLRELLDRTKPAMAAEYWHNGRPWSPQFLLVGVPTLSPGAARPTHFDRIDDRVAHCVTGNSLSRGDYPVGVAFPHPQQEGASFHIVNLPTPRRQMAYQYYVRTDPAKRLSALSRRTLDRFLAEKHPLAEPELLMLGQLDPREVSRFAGQYLLLLADGRLVDSHMPRPGGRPSRFGMIAAQLAENGTKEAAPGLTEAIAKNAFLPPTPQAPYRLDWVAALSIATRDPWPEVDSWLANHLAETTLLVEERPIEPEAGATAAAILLRRHGQIAARFGLEPATDPLLAKLHVHGYRFADADARTKFQQWWDHEKVAPAAQNPSTPAF